MLAPTPVNQPDRLAAIRRYDLGTQSHKGAFDGIVELAAQICNCPIALVSIVHEDDQRFEAVCGLNLSSTDLPSSICSHAILQEDLLEISDTRLDMRTIDNPLVVDESDPMLFYAGAQIRTASGIALGSLCVLDRRPRRLGDAERRGLRILADQVMQRLELHDALRQQDAIRREGDHRVKNNLASIAALTRMTARSASPEVKAALQAVERQIDAMSELHGMLHRAEASEAPVQVQDFLNGIAGRLMHLAPEGVVVESRIDRLMAEAGHASALGMLANEMISNACKHAFPNGGPGRIVLQGVQTGTRYRLSCDDDGGGGAVVGEPGLGRRIMEASALQVGGNLEFACRDDGCHVAVEFAVPSI
ncbi:histidine kinase dimerization/phosphoacceptor domain -containing protein [Jannaschia pohangensis]|uniref:Two-component sensor histidine kinase, contains HisKA and HATPase domains n=1 Tax=Jannaschia pohangensis TaxID=390807 RepID=A0A1I3GBQ8_9RHOB|nr:histidine kinase dimerization/phosphoacceptor domain -containing protein [Jannaschia pohangensis]SFI20926.1 Two-component sensor histidine kinase, contains HisKA and HATPase domains [Jannaschia pohangensis]